MMGLLGKRLAGGDGAVGEGLGVSHWVGRKGGCCFG